MPVCLRVVNGLHSDMTRDPVPVRDRHRPSRAMHGRSVRAAGAGMVQSQGRVAALKTPPPPRACVERPHRAPPPSQASSPRRAESTTRKTPAPPRPESGVARSGGSGSIPPAPPAHDPVAALAAELERIIGTEPCDRYFRAASTLCIRDGAVVVEVPSEFLAGNLDRRFGRALRDAASRVLGDQAAVRFGVLATPPDSASSTPGSTPDPAPPHLRASLHGQSSPRPVRRPRTGAAWRRLDSFIVGRSNRFAFSAAEQIASGDRRFSPLFIHGRCGLGKTHLLQGIADQFLRTHPGARVKLVTAEAFTNAFIAAVQNRTLDEFRQRFRRVDLLCIDDVHFISNKHKTQSELLHTFDAVDIDGKLVALASDEHPQGIERLSAGLSSRFMQGAIVQLEPPDAELRCRILHEVSQTRGLALSEQAIAALSDHAARRAMLQGNAASVRELIGLVTQVEAFSRLMPDLIASDTSGLALVHAALGLNRSGETDQPSGPRRPVRLETIIDVVCARLGVTREEFTSSRRARAMVLARAMVVLLARRMSNHSFPEIARAMGRPNHSSVITMHNRILAQIETGQRADLPGLDAPIHIADLADQIQQAVRTEPVRPASASRASSTDSGGHARRAG